MGNLFNTLNKLKTNIFGGPGNTGFTDPPASRVAKLGITSTPTSLLKVDPLAFASYSYPRDVTNNVQNGHYMLFYVNTQNRSSFEYTNSAGQQTSTSQFETITIDTTSFKNVEDALVVFTKSITEHLSSSAIVSANHNESITISSESMLKVAASTQSGIQKQLNIMENQIGSMTSAASQLDVLQSKFVEMEKTHSKALLESSESAVKSARQFDDKLALHLQSVDRKAKWYNRLRT
jgi:hypothetical protein